MEPHLRESTFLWGSIRAEAGLRLTAEPAPWAVRGLTIPRASTSQDGVPSCVFVPMSEPSPLPVDADEPDR
jgi:hypothetical protein